MSGFLLFYNDLLWFQIDIKSNEVNADISEVDIYLSNLGCGNVKIAKTNCFFAMNVQDVDGNLIAPINFVIPAPIKLLNFTRPVLKVCR